MGTYRQLDLKERGQIEILRKEGKGIREIARLLGRSGSTISWELKKQRKDYCAESAQKETWRKRHQPRILQRVITGAIEQTIRDYLVKDWSPEQIVGRLGKEGFRNLPSFQSIYRFIERDDRDGGKLKKHLRILRKQGKHRTRPKYVTVNRRLTPRLTIEERPKIVEKRSRLGDYERDTVLGKRNGILLLTLVDRTSRRVRIASVSKLCSNEVHEATCRLLEHELVHTITNDNGTEFQRFKETQKALSVAIYFAKAYHAWERGTNENTNGLIRQYFPRKKPIPNLRDDEIQAIENHLNNRPRKCLDYKTPNEIHALLKNAECSG